MTHGELHSALPTYAFFFVLVGVVGIMHTSVIGSSAEYVIGAVPMRFARIVSLIVFLVIALIAGRQFSLGSIFRVVFPVLIAVMTLLPFLGALMGPLTGSIAIVCYCACGMLIYLFLIREGRCLELSSALLASIYTLGSSGFLFIGLCIGLALQAVSASFDVSLLTLLAFAAIYPLVLVLAFVRQRDRGKDRLPAKAMDPKEQSDPRVFRHNNQTQLRGSTKLPTSTFDVAVSSVADAYGLTAREREVLAYLASGRSIRYIAETLVISENTAWTHTKRIYAKTKTHGKDELMDLVENQIG